MSDRETLKQIHRFLFPEEYPADEVADHPAYEPGDECYQWDSDTIDEVARMVRAALGV